MAENPEAVLKEAQSCMEKALASLQRSFGRVRTGRANLSLLDGIRVPYYGTPTPLNQVANLSAPEPRLITIQPWETSLIPAIEKAIMQSEMDLNPANDGKLIRISIPKLTEERRKDLVKVVKGMAEDARVAVRNTRRDANSQMDDLCKDKVLTEDELHKQKDNIQETTNDFIKKIEEQLAAKETEIMEV